MISFWTKQSQYNISTNGSFQASPGKKKKQNCTKLAFYSYQYYSSFQFYFIQNYLQKTSFLLPIEHKYLTNWNYKTYNQRNFSITTI